MAQIFQRTFSVETTSAMFMHGANPQIEAEIRPPSIKGVMRYWFRAIAGAYYETTQVKELENKVFGATDNGSKLVVRVNWVEQEVNFKRKTDRNFLLPHKSQEGQKSASAAVGTKSQFNIVLQPFPPSNQSNQEFEAACWSLWVAINLGGFGQRARRGAGSLKLLNVTPGIDDMPLHKSYQDIAALQIDLQAGLQRARSAIAALSGKSVTQLRSNLDKEEAYAILANICAEIQITKITAPNEQEARTKLMLGLRPYKNPAFGLPYMLTAGDDRVQGRHASPLHLHLVKLEGINNFALVQTALYARFHNIVRERVNWQAVEDYLHAFPAENKVEVNIKL